MIKIISEFARLSTGLKSVKGAGNTEISLPTIET